jgi:iron complex transport system substrate-binding protein
LTMSEIRTNFHFRYLLRVALVQPAASWRPLAARSQANLLRISCTRFNVLLVRLIRGTSRLRPQQMGRDFPRGVLVAFSICFLTAAHTAEAQNARIIALGGDVTEIVYRLGEGSRLAGRDTTSTYPPEAKALPDVGYFRQLGAEGVLSLKPDLILASAAAGPPPVIEQLRSAGVRIVQLSSGFTPDILLAKVTTIAEELGVPRKGAALVEELKSKIETARSEAGKLPGRPRVLFLINAGNGAPLASGRDTAADALISLAEAENVFSAHTGYKPISAEAAAASAPDAIGLMEQTLAAMGGVDGVAKHPALSLTPAARNRKIFGRDGSYLLNFGPRLPEAILDFARAIREKGSS